MITILKWKGKVVSENRRLRPGNGRWYANADYKAFLEGMAWTFRGQIPAGRVYGRPDVIIVMSVGPRLDHHNMHKPILDAIERAGLVKNDRDIGWVKMAPPERHPQGQEDEITVILTGELAGK